MRFSLKKEINPRIILRERTQPLRGEFLSLHFTRYCSHLVSVIEGCLLFSDFLLTEAAEFRQQDIERLFCAVSTVFATPDTILTKV